MDWLKALFWVLVLVVAKIIDVKAAYEILKHFSLIK